nr:MAG TPA: hypothetical protein [Bacteriophage sp.]
MMCTADRLWGCHILRIRVETPPMAVIRRTPILK